MGIGMDKAFELRGMEETLRFLSATLPRQTKKAVRMALSNAGRKARSEGLKRTREAYTMRAKDRRKVDARARVRGDSVEIAFKGAPGTPLRAFTASPRRPSGDRAPKRRPASGVGVQVRRDGTSRPALGPNGEKTFWFRGKNGAWLLGYRKGKRISTADLLAASPIQALIKKGTAEDMAGMLGPYTEKEIARQLGRVLKGEIS